MMFGLAVRPVLSEPVPGLGDSVHAVCRSTGSWSAEVRVIAPHDASAIMASMMFGIDACDVSAREVRDAMGELANVLAGSLKGQVAGPWELSPPDIEPVSKAFQDSERAGEV